MIRVAVAILYKGNKILACRRKRGSRYELQWEFPGGKLEHNESGEDCVRRELFEELNITIDIPVLLETKKVFYDDGGWFEVSYFLVRDFSGKLNNTVFEQIRWVTLEELKQLDILEGNKSFIERLTI
ncbi:MAG: (deoxy)nucleoside triphosphate pyrophosphohydrolase [Bacteroidota bacterium]